MTAYKNLKKWTRPDHYFGAKWEDYYTGIGHHRNSDVLTQSNFATFLREIGGESDTVIIIRESHWAVGWVEWIAIHESDHAALAIADDLLGCIKEYPILDESDFNYRETEAANDIWASCYSTEERIEYIRKYRDQFNFRNFADMLSCVRGKYFAGYASELLN